MYDRRLLPFLILIVTFIVCCAPTYKERISSDPPSAKIYWGYSQTDFVDTAYVTPYQRTIYGRAWEARCYQVKKEGYYDSEVVCKPRQSSDRTIHFILTAIPVEKSEPPEPLRTEEKPALSPKERYRQISKASRIILTRAVKESTPGVEGPAAKYLERFLRASGHTCYVEIVRSRKSKDKFAILINRYASEGEFDKDKFTEAAIMATAILAEHVKWGCSDVFFDYSAIFVEADKDAGWAIMSVEDCRSARNILTATDNINKFTSYWKEKIQYISDADPKPTL